MTERQQTLLNNVEKHKEMILNAERWIWAHPQTGYTEWEAHNYLVEKFEMLGYELVLAGNIPGFYTDVQTGKPGPKLCIIGELDALNISGHPEAVDGNVHCCGHHGQCAAVLGIAAALKEPGALEGMSGSIRLMLVPAEETIQLGFREKLCTDHIIQYYTGKKEFLARGCFDGVDLAMMVHGGGRSGNLAFSAMWGHIGNLSKNFVFKGKCSHAGSNPFDGINAQYAAMLGLQACNNLRETFKDEEHIRFHPVINGANCAVNVIPDRIEVESFVRGCTMEAVIRENQKINRALAGAALAMGASVELRDRAGCAPTQCDKNFMKVIEQCCIDMVGKECVSFDYDTWSTGSTDFGDLTCVMPGVMFNVHGGYAGANHCTDYHVDNPYRLCVDSAKVQLLVTEALLTNDAMEAKSIVHQFVPRFSSVQHFLETLDKITLDKEAVIYDEEGHVTIDFFND